MFGLPMMEVKKRPVRWYLGDPGMYKASFAW